MKKVKLPQITLQLKVQESTGSVLSKRTGSAAYQIEKIWKEGELMTAI